ncbi:MAG: hypothetical protein IH985_02025 [Planctomycetes bacterium]|nr:hypothetical protein [Planctomycetota bacterium]
MPIDGTSSSRSFRVLAGTAIALLVILVSVALWFAWYGKSVDVRELIQSIPLAHISDADFVDDMRFNPFQYGYFQSDPISTEELERLVVGDGWSIADPSIALDEMAARWPGWFNPAHAATAPFCIQSSDGRTRIWAFEDGTVLVRVRVGGRRTRITGPAHPPPSP